MDTSKRVDRANDQLNRVLGFFSRLDAKHSVVLAVDTGMLAFLVARAPQLTSFTWPLAIAPSLTVLLIAVSFGFLYAGTSPALDGGQQSLVYFGEIAQRTESKYIDAFAKVSEEEYLKDLLGQVWRNSEILTQKFGHLKKALLFLVLAIVPWLVSLVLFAGHVPIKP